MLLPVRRLPAPFSLGFQRHETRSSTPCSLGGVRATAMWKATKPSYVLYDFNRKKVVGILNTAPVLHIGDLIAWDDDDL
jgi:hypothetical protein